MVLLAICPLALFQSGTDIGSGLSRLCDLEGICTSGIGAEIGEGDGAGGGQLEQERAHREKEVLTRA
jgi:hypothetical protein